MNISDIFFLIFKFRYSLFSVDSDDSFRLIPINLSFRAQWSYYVLGFFLPILNELCTINKSFQAKSNISLNGSSCTLMLTSLSKCHMEIAIAMWFSVQTSSFFKNLDSNVLGSSYPIQLSSFWSINLQMCSEKLH